MKQLRGYIQEGALPMVLADIIRERFTGILHVEREKVKKEFFFLDGNIISSRSNLLGETLGRIALISGEIKNEVYQKALTLMKNKSMKFGEAVKALGWELDIDKLLLLQLKHRLFDVFTWRSGTYIILKKPVSPEKVYPYLGKIDTLKLLAEGIMSKINGSLLEYRKKELMDSFYTAGTPLPRVKLLPELKEVLKKPVKGKEILNLIKKPEPQNIQTMYFYVITGALKKVEVEKPKEKTPEVKVPSEEIDLYTRLNEKYNEIKEKNYFEILGVERNANDSDIRNAYYKLAMEYHPDRYFNKSEPVKDLVERIFTVINEAFNTLSDPQRRKEYEMELEGKTLSPEKGSQILEAEIQFKKAEILDRAGKLREAIDLYRWAFKLNPQESEYRAKLGWALYRLGKKTGNMEMKEEGVSQLMKAYGENPDSAEITYLIASYYRAEGNREKVVEYLKKTLSLDPYHESAKRELTFFKKG